MPRFAFLLLCYLTCQRSVNTVTKADSCWLFLSVIAACWLGEEPYCISPRTSFCCSYGAIFCSPARTILDSSGFQEQLAYRYSDARQPVISGLSLSKLLAALSASNIWHSVFGKVSAITLELDVFLSGIFAGI